MKKILIFILITTLSVTSFALKKSGEIKLEKNNSEIFTLINNNGKIEINGWENDYILIEYVKTVGGFLASAKDIAFDVKEGKNIIVKTIYRKGKNNKKVDFNIHIPKNFNFVELTTSNGNINISSLHGNVNANTSNGDIYAEKIDGITNLVTSNGNIEASEIAVLENLTSSNGDLIAEIKDITENGAKLITSNGNIILDIPPKLSSNLEVRDSNSSIKIKNNNKKILNASTSNGHVEVNIKN